MPQARDEHPVGLAEVGAPGSSGAAAADVDLAWLCQCLRSRGQIRQAPLIISTANRAARERVHLLVWSYLGDAGVRHEGDPEARLALDLASRRAVVEDAARGRELARVVAALDAAGCQPVLLKGAALAQTHYEASWMRPRLDTDLLVPPDQRRQASRVFEALGYHRPPFVSGDLVMYQEPYVRAERGGLEHVFDLHWRVANPQVVSTVLDHGSIVNRAGMVDVGGVTCRVPHPVDALLLACVHRAAHHQDADHLLWLFDIHLLAAGLSHAEWDDLRTRAAAGAVTALCARGLSLTSARLATEVPPWVRDAPAMASAEPSAVFLRASITPARRLMSDLGALSTGARLRLLRETILPPASYMREAFGGSGWLPWLYVRRVVRGVGKWRRPMGR